jgi:ubiquinone/menaquinone biosynthesis C-methylase UbiE
MSQSVVDGTMRSYYERRAGEYDDWWLGSGQFARRDRPGWSEEVSALVDVVAALPAARVLDVACGTGFLTAHLAGEVVGLDQSAAMLRVAAERVGHGRLVCAEAVPLPFRDGQFDRIFTSHFYGHLLAGERAAFLAEASRVARRLVVVDSALRDDVQREEWQERVLNDGSTHRVYKRYFDASDLAEELGGAAVLHAGHWFVAVATEERAAGERTARAACPPSEPQPPACARTPRGLD